MIKMSNVKRIILILFLFILLYVIVNWVNIIDHFQSGYMSVKTIDEHDLEVLLAELEEMTDKPNLSFNNHDLAFDWGKGLYYATQDIENGIWDGFFASSRGRLYWKDDRYFERYDNALAEGHVFSLYCIDEEEGSYCVYPIVFTGMPMMVVMTETGEQIGDDLQNAKMWVSDMKFAGQEYQISDCQMKVRGQYSRYHEKPGYKLILDRKLSLLGMRRDEDWILAALYDDEGLIHNKFSYDVWRNIASDNSVTKDDGTTMEYVELFCNNTYMGVYGLVERIDAKELQLDKSDILYKCSVSQRPDEAIQEDFGLSAGYDVMWPKEYSHDTWIPLKNYLDIFMDGEITDYGEARAVLDMENAIDYNIFIVFAWASDNDTRRNMCIVADYDNSSKMGYRILKIPWDCNATWGNGTAPRVSILESKLYRPERLLDADICNADIRAMYQCYSDEIQILMLERWRYLRQDILSEKRLIEMLDEDFAYLNSSGAYDRNYVRWNGHGQEYWKNEYIYGYVKDRLAFLDAYLEKSIEVSRNEQDFTKAERKVW